VDCCTINDQRLFLFVTSWWTIVTLPFFPKDGLVRTIDPPAAPVA
jgi:hypothetical protein